MELISYQGPVVQACASRRKLPSWLELINVGGKPVSWYLNLPGNGLPG
jgi:hypothetical protein